MTGLLCLPTGHRVPGWGQAARECTKSPAEMSREGLCSAEGTKQWGKRKLNLMSVGLQFCNWFWFIHFSKNNLVWLDVSYSSRHPWKAGRKNTRTWTSGSSSIKSPRRSLKTWSPSKITMWRSVLNTVHVATPLTLVLNDHIHLHLALSCVCVGVGLHLCVLFHQVLSNLLGDLDAFDCQKGDTQVLANGELPNGEPCSVCAYRPSVRCVCVYRPSRSESWCLNLLECWL